MIRKTYSFLLLLMATLFVSLLSCKDDKDDAVRPKLVGEFRTPYVVEMLDYWMSGAHSGQYDDTFMCRSFSVIKFTDDTNVEFYQVHHKDCVTYHRQSGAELKNETWTSVGENWLKKGSTSVKLTYQIDDKENKLSLSSGKVYFLKLDENGQKYMGLTNETGKLVYVLASVDDEKYNSVMKNTWEKSD
ncbi:MAG: hypothetical protein J6T52_06325 [Bacteroidaceae bacterium]|nr:hypothetical protein [Bacteroidaceae bacterium]